MPALPLWHPSECVHASRRHRSLLGAQPSTSQGSCRVAPIARLSQRDIDIETEDGSPGPSQRYATPSVTRRPPRPAVRDLPRASRPPPQTPEPVPVIHSSAYQQTLVQSLSSTDDEQSSEAVRTGTMVVKNKRAVSVQRADESFDGTAIEWALRKVDASLDEMETNPSAIHKAVYGISRGPVGTATTTAVQAAAKLTVKATVEAAKVAAPIGKWALTAGAKAAAELIKAAVVETVKAEGRKKDTKQRNK